MLEGFDRNAGWGLRLMLVFIVALFAAFLLVLGVLAPGSAVAGSASTARAASSRSVAGLSGFFGSHSSWFVRGPLADLLAVQVLYCGVQDYHLEVGEAGTPGSVVHRQYDSYQLNLVLDDKSEPRLNIASHSDDKWMREAGRRLAEFLDVPFFDQRSPGV